MLLALSAVGIDLTALSVLGGALGVGIGLGLQKLAANYVSGFVILAGAQHCALATACAWMVSRASLPRSTRVTPWCARPRGESIVPNEQLVTSRVENLSLADSNLFQSTMVSVGYDSDVDQGDCAAAAGYAGAAKGTARTSAVGGLNRPSALMAWNSPWAIGSTIWRGQLALRSDINRAILATLRQHQIEIPFPQRVVHQR